MVENILLETRMKCVRRITFILLWRCCKQLYYHDKRYVTIRYWYSEFTRSESNKSSSIHDTECKQIALKKVIFYLKDSKMSNPGDLYPVMELETMYSDLLKSDKIHHNNHTTTFADLLVKYVPGLNKKTANKCVSVFFDTAAIGLNMSSETYFDSLVRRMLIFRVNLTRYLLNWCN